MKAIEASRGDTVIAPDGNKLKVVRAYDNGLTVEIPGVGPQFINDEKLDGWKMGKEDEEAVPEKKPVKRGDAVGKAVPRQG